MLSRSLSRTVQVQRRRLSKAHEIEEVSGAPEVPDTDFDFLDTTKEFDLSSLIDSNPYFQAGFGLTLMGGAIGLIRQGLATGWYFAKKQMLISLEVTSRDPAYPWILSWLNENTNKHGKVQHLSVSTNVAQNDTGSKTSSFSFSPNVGMHFISYKRRIISYERKREQAMMDLATGTPFETVVLTSIGRDRQLFEDLLEDARKAAELRDKGKTVIYTNYGPDGWKMFGEPRTKKPLESVILDKSIKGEVLEDVTDFIRSGEWYRQRGIPYRRGYLFHGPPGGGKTSFIMALAGHLDHNICILNLSENGLTDDRLALSLSTAPPKSIVLLEDIDAAFSKNRESSDNIRANFVTFSGLLNCLDGVAASEERIVFMTTNHYDQLDPALIRPGRVDVIEKIDWASPIQIQNLFSKFFENDHRAEEFADIFKGVLVSMAELQGFFMLHKGNANKAMKDAPQFRQILEAHADYR